MSNQAYSNFKVDYHRNGISGWPFWVVTFDWQDADQVRHMVATVPCVDNETLIKRSDYLISVLDVGLLAKGVIAFGPNSWRGDNFHFDVWAAIDAYEKSL